MVVNLYMVSLDNRAGKPEREAVARVDSPPGDVEVRARPEGDVASGVTCSYLEISIRIQ